MSDLKQEILADIERKSDVFIKASSIQYRIRCPICGDSQKNPRDAHCYIKCSYDPSEPLLYYCFKCNSSGRVTDLFLKKLGVRKDLISMIEKQKFNRITSFMKLDIDVITGTPDVNSPQYRYIVNRLGPGFTVEDLDKFRIVWNTWELRNHVSKSIKYKIPNNSDSISFLSDDKSLLNIRSFTDDDPRWTKLRLYPSPNKLFYAIKSVVDLFTQDQITVNIAEGIFDVLSIYRNFNNGPNSVFFASLGSNYIRAVDYIISKGFVGSNVVLKIYIDWDIEEAQLKRELKKYKWLFGRISIFKNVLYKDVGVTADKIKLVEMRI